MNIFLLRGLIREKEHWGDIQDFIKKEFPEANIFVPEIQGVGEFHQMVSSDNFDEMISFMRQNHQEAFDSGEENMVIAMSLGGMIARRWAEVYPDDFKRVVLINSSFKGITPLFKRLRPGAIFRFAYIFFTFSIEERERKILNLVANNHERKLSRVDEWVRIQRERPVSRKSFINQLKAAMFSVSIKTKPKSSKLFIIAGKGDRLCHYTSSELLHAQWGGDLKIHPWAGHDIPIDDPQWLISNIKEWCDS